MTLDELNHLSEVAFFEALKGVFEHSPWVVAGVVAQRPFASVAALQAALESVLYGADAEVQLALIRAHPDLAAKLDELPALTEFSQAEQARAGFAALPSADLERLRQLLAEYRGRFEHPFILCVSEHAAVAVLPILEVRVLASADAERMACLFQIARIGWHRICSLITS